MKAIYLDCFSGISGNMLLGAFLQAGVPEAYLKEELKKLPMADEFSLQVSDVKKNGILAVYVDVLLRDLPAGHDHGTESETAAAAVLAAHEHGPAAEHGHRHDHGHGHGHAHDHEAAHVHQHAHVHRTLADIRTLIEGTALSAAVKNIALRIFEVLAEAEGKVHGQPKDEVHFHEVGAVDSIVDIVGAAICLDYLEIEKIFVSRLNTGSGTVQCAHGVMMVPAPATAELLQGIPSYHRGDEKEMTTPTGAAVVKALASFEENIPVDFLTERIAYGAGYWDLTLPNVLRLYLGEYQGRKESCRYLIEANIDDMSGQLFGYASERLLAAGALDVWTTPIFMKKNRPAQILSVLTDEEHKELCCDIIFQETSSIGLRIQTIDQRREAVRRMARVHTAYGEVACKISAYKGELVSVSAEYEDCRRLAQEHGVPLKMVQQAALEEVSHRLGE